MLWIPVHVRPLICLNSDFALVTLSHKSTLEAPVIHHGIVSSRLLLLNHNPLVQFHMGRVVFVVSTHLLLRMIIIFYLVSRVTKNCGIFLRVTVIRQLWANQLLSIWVCKLHGQKEILGDWF